MKVRIEYCVPWNYEPRALRAKARLIERGAEEVELVKGVAGVFEITIDGKLVFSKKQLGRFPEDAEIDALAAG
jgi:selenoprotein W-related protein